MTQPQTAPTREKEAKAASMLVGLALLCAVGYVAAYVAAGDKTPRGTTVEGVDIGTRSVMSESMCHLRRNPSISKS